MEANSIHVIPIDTFKAAVALREAYFGSNRIVTIKRESFGNLTSLEEMELHDNIVQSVDEDFLNELMSLRYMYFHFNVCGTGYFYEFMNNKVEYLKQLKTCTDNYKFNIGEDEQLLKLKISSWIQNLFRN